MTIQEQFAEALCSDRPLEHLSDVIRGLILQGYQQESLAEELEALRSELRTAGREQDEDTVLEVMDFLTGWCSPHMRI